MSLTPDQIRSARLPEGRDGFCGDWSLVVLNYRLTNATTLYFVGFTIGGQETAIPITNQEELMALDPIIDWTRSWNLYIVYN